MSKKFVRFVRFVVTGSVCGAKRAPHTESNSRRELCKVCKAVLNEKEAGRAKECKLNDSRKRGCRLFYFLQVDRENKGDGGEDGGNGEGSHA